MAYMAEKIHHNVVYYGEQKNNTFESYVTIQNEEHTILKNLEEHGYKVINECLKFWYLIAGIKYGALNSVKTIILSTSLYCKEFDASVTLYQYYIKQAQDMNVELNISGVGTKYGDSLGKETLTGDIEDKYYKTEV